MTRSKRGGVERGQTISFRVPADTPDYLLKHLQHLREKEKRNFSAKIAEYVLDGVGNSYERKRESITVPLPHKLTKEQRDWMKHKHSEALMGTILYHLLADPVRATALLGSLNSRSPHLDEALYLQEDQVLTDQSSEHEEAPAQSEQTGEDDLEAFEWSGLDGDTTEEPSADEGLDDLLGDFLSTMNK